MIFTKKMVYTIFMINLATTEAETFSRETFQCDACNQDFEARVATWVDVSKTPQAKQALLKREFNMVSCTHCGCRSFSGTPFFYEDFEEGLLVAVFPGIPDKRGEVEVAIRSRYGYYPTLEFFYDMTQIWMLLYFQEHYQANGNLRKLSRIGQGEERLRKMLRFLKENPLMIDIRETLNETFVNDAANDELVEILGQAVYALEEMLPWPIDRHCLCGADLSKEFICCGRPVELAEHEQLLSRHYIIYCPVCKESLSGASCDRCGRVYTWKLGIVATYKKDDAPPHRTSPAENNPHAQL
jgi:hypothetical protein